MSIKTVYICDACGKNIKPGEFYVITTHSFLPYSDGAIMPAVHITNPVQHFHSACTGLRGGNPCSIGSDSTADKIKCHSFTADMLSNDLGSIDAVHIVDPVKREE